jgi:biopolymer transport protein ExbD
MAKKTPELNTASMADISFLLLTFFLLTSSIDTDLGINRLLPPPPDPNIEQDDIQIKKRNMFVVLINTYDQLLVRGRPGDLRTLRKEAKEFITNPYNDPNLPEKENPVNIQYIGEYSVSKGIISLQNDRGTSYGMYIKVQNELTAAFNELRDELSMDKFGVKYEDIKNPEYAQAIRKAIPMKLSEAEPKDIGGRK